MSNEPLPTSDRVRQTLDRVSASLGCTVDALLTGCGLPVDLVQTDELLKLWSSLHTEEERERVLRAIREIAVVATN